MTEDMTDDMKMGMDDEITGDDKLWAFLGYIIPLVALIAMLMEDKKSRPFVKYHAVHALLITVATVVLSITACLWVIPWLYGIYVGYKAYQGEWTVVPMATDMAKKQGWI
jgi:uncharacterized membrane protein